MYRFVLRGIVYLASAALLAGVLLGGGLVLRLAWGPISLAGLAPTVATALNDRIAAEAPGWRIELADAALRFDPETTRLGVRFDDVALVGPDGALAARAPSLALRVDLLGALGGEIRLTGVELIGPQALLRRTPEGFFRLAMLDGAAASHAEADAAADARYARARAEQDPDATAAEFSLVAQILDGMTRERGAPSFLDRFEQLIVRDLDLVYEDALGGVRWRAEGARLVFERDADGASARLDAQVDTQVDTQADARGDGAPTRLTVTGRRAAGDARVDVSAEFEGAPAARIAEQLPDLAALAALDARLEGALRARIDIASGDLIAASATLRAEGGALDLGGGGRVAIDLLDAGFGYDAVSERLALDRLRLRADGVTTEASGVLQLSRDTPEGPITGGDGRLVFGPTEIDRADLVVEPLTLNGAEADVALRAVGEGGLDLRLAALRVDLVDTIVSGRAELRLREAAPLALDLDLTASAFPATRLAALWPAGAAPGARAWVAEHIRGGAIASARAAVRLGGAEEALDLAFTVEDLAGTYLGAMTPITGARGEGRVTLERFSLDLAAAEVDLGADGRLDLSGSRFVIPDFAPDPPPAEIEIRAAGPVRALLALIDQEPLGFPAKLGLDPATVAGSAVSTTVLRLPLAKALLLEDVSAEAEAELEGLALRPRGLDVDVAFRRASLSVDTRALTLDGDARLDGQPMRLTWREVFAPGRGEDRSRVRLRGRISAEALQARGAPKALGLEGEASAALDVGLRDGAPATFTLEADLADLGVGAPTLGWRKRPGVEGRLTAAGALPGGGIAIDRLSVAAAGLAAEGALRLDASGALERLRLERLRLGETDLALELAPNPGVGGLIGSAVGATLDLRPLFAAQNTPADSPAAASADAPSDPLALTVAVDRLLVGEDLTLRSVELDATRDVRGRVSARATGAIGKADVVLALTPEGEGARFVVESGDAGEALRGLGFVDEAFGGALEIEGELRADGRIDGRFSIEDVVIRDAPVLAEILSVATVVGAFDRIASGGISFQRVRGGFGVSPKWIEIREAAATGPSLGLTLDGRISRPDGRLDLAGSVSPAFVLNGLLSGVPIVGDLLTGGDGEGLVGVAYRVSGTRADPSVTVNPLSALTPGPFRQIFTDTGRDESAAPSGQGASPGLGRDLGPSPQRGDGPPPGIGTRRDPF